MALSADDYYQMLKGDTPQGRAWPTEDEATVNLLLRAIAEELARLDGQVDYLLDEIDPVTTQDMLGDWERILGLPDACVEEGQSLQDRKAAVLAKLTNQGAQTPQFYIDLAARYGYTITITEFQPFVCGESRCGEPLTIESIRFYWQVSTALDTIKYFRTGASTAGDPLRDWGNDVLECVINKLKPAHTIVNFVYT